VTPTPSSQELSVLFDAHVDTEFVAKDAEATMATMTDDPEVIHVPVLTGGRGTRQLHDFYRDQFIPSWPQDVELEPVSRTVDGERVVAEFIVSFTHSREMPFWLPGIAPTGRRVELPLVVIMGFRDDKVAYEHVYWDQATLLVQVGLLDPAQLPALGVTQARGLVDASVPLNELISGAT
jgi:carboxymethylenebutenolidase